MKTPHPRPRRLSNPDSYCDQATRARLLATPDDQLTWRDLQVLLGPYTPVGAYEESSYFLPVAIDYVRAHEEDALDLVTSVVWFASEYENRLRRDRLIGETREAMAGLLASWTERFEVRHEDIGACRGKGSALAYGDIVRNAETVIATLNDLVRFKTHHDVALEFVRRIARSGNDPIRSAWFLELSRSHTEDDAFEPVHPEIASVIGDADLAAHHFTTVRSAPSRFDWESTYWSNTRYRLTS